MLGGFIVRTLRAPLMPYYRKKAIRQLQRAREDQSASHAAELELPQAAGGMQGIMVVRDFEYVQIFRLLRHGPVCYRSLP